MPRRAAPDAWPVPPKLSRAGRPFSLLSSRNLLSLCAFPRALASPQASKSKLPDTGSEYEGAGGTVADAVSFLLSNFAEMNKLWVRMQHQGPVREREQREKERMDLRILVGTNLASLSKLEGVDLAMYQSSVFPQILEQVRETLSPKCRLLLGSRQRSFFAQVVNCKDAIAQQYLMECLTQVFPTEFHIPTLELWLQHTKWLSPGCEVKQLLIGMLTRLQAAPVEDDDASAEADEVNPTPFSRFHEHLAGLAPVAATGEAVPGVSTFEPVALLELYDALLTFSLAVYPKRLGYIEATLSACLALLESSPKGLAVTNAKAAKVLFGLVSRPLEHFSAVLAILQLSSWPPLLAHLSFGKQKEVAAVLVGAVIAQGVQITASADAGKLLAFVNPLMLDDPDDEVDQDAAREKAIDEDTAAELGPVSRLIHAFSSPSTDDQCRILNATHRQASNAAHRRSPFALVPVVFACLPLARAIKVRVDNGETVEVGVHKLLSFVATIIQTLVPLAPNLALRLCLLSAHVADTVGEEGDAYEFFTQAFTTYEEAVSESRAQLAAVTHACATLHHTKRFDAETYDTPATKNTQYSARLLKKPDQCRAVVKAAMLFASNAKNIEDEADEPTRAEREPRRVLECLQRALKIADSCKVSSTHTPLFVEILDAYLFHFEKKNTAVLPSYLSSLLQLIEQQVAEESAQAGPSAKHFANCQVSRVLPSYVQIHATPSCIEADR